MLKNFVKYAARRQAYNGLRKLFSGPSKSGRPSGRTPVRPGNVTVGPKLAEYADDTDFHPELASIKAQLQSMDAYAFEDLVADVWRARGFDAKQVGGSGDGGVDVIVRRPNGATAIQAKRYGPNTRVSPAEVREIAALAHRDEITDTAIVTTSDLTEAAHEEARRYNVDVYDVEDFMILVDKVGAEYLLAEYLPGVSLK